MSRARDALMALHGISLEGLNAALYGARAPGELIGPSLAIEALGNPAATRANFGDVQLLFDPQVLNRADTRIFGADAYTPRVPRSPFEGDELYDLLGSGHNPDSLPGFSAWRMLNNPNRVGATDVDELDLFLRSQQAQDFGRLVRGEIAPQNQTQDFFFGRYPAAQELQDMFEHGTRNAEFLNPNPFVPGPLWAGLTPELTHTAGREDVLRQLLVNSPAQARSASPAQVTTYELLDFRSGLSDVDRFDLDLALQDALMFGGAPIPARTSPTAARNLPQAGEATTQVFDSLLQGFGAPYRTRDAVQYLPRSRAGYAEAKVEGRLPLDDVVGVLPNTGPDARAVAADAREATRLIREATGRAVPVLERDQGNAALGRWLFGGAGAAGAAAAGSGEAQAMDENAMRLMMQQHLLQQLGFEDVPYEQILARRLAEGPQQADGPPVLPQAAAPEAQGFYDPMSDALRNRMARTVRREGPVRTPEQAAEDAREMAELTRREAENFPGGLPGLGAWRMLDMATPVPTISRLLGYNPDPGVEDNFWGDALAAGLWGAGGAATLRGMRRNME